MSRSPMMPATARKPSLVARFTGLETLWVQITGTLCNLRCTHCFLSCAPDNHALELMSREQIRHYLRQAEDLGVKEIYFTGGEPFLHPEALEILEDALKVAPAAVLTNGVLITEPTAARLGSLAAAASYSLEIRVSLDAPEEAANDAIRGAGTFRKALRGVRRLQDAGLMPIVTACELVAEEEGLGAFGDAAAPGGLADSVGEDLPRGVRRESIPSRPGAGSFYHRLYRLLRDQGIERPRVKVLPVFNMGELEGRRSESLLTGAMLEGFDTDTLQCSGARLVAHDGIYACPILAGEAGARMAADDLAEAERPCPLYHPACTTCVETGMTCRNY